MRSHFVSLFIAMLLACVPSTLRAQTFTLLDDFGTHDTDPTNPEGSLVQGRNGEIYGASAGTSLDIFTGTVFGMTTSGGASILYTFASDEQPQGLTLGSDGAFYGVGNYEGSSGYGTIFKVTTNGVRTMLYNFTGGSDGGFPTTAPIQGPDGSFYGTVPVFGSLFCGTVYKITPSGAFTTLYEFDSTHGCGPHAALVLGTDGNFYGTTTGGGPIDGGVIFRITPRGQLTVLHGMQALDGEPGSAAMTQAADGNFYGVTYSGGGSYGTAFKITPTGVFKVLYNFTENDGNPGGTGLIQATDGKLYGISGGNGYGSIFSMTTRGSLTQLFYFDDTNGDVPQGLIQDTNGMFYGVTYYGGTLGYGVFYSFDVGLHPFVTFLPSQRSGKAGTAIGIFGQNFRAATAVSFNGTPAQFTTNSDTFLTATVPSGATSGFVIVTTRKGTLTSNVRFQVKP